MFIELQQFPYEVCTVWKEIIDLVHLNVKHRSHPGGLSIQLRSACSWHCCSNKHFSGQIRCSNSWLSPLCLASTLFCSLIWSQGCWKWIFQTILSKFIIKYMKEINNKAKGSTCKTLIMAIYESLVLLFYRAQFFPLTFDVGIGTRWTKLGDCLQIYSCNLKNHDVSSLNK